MISTPRSLTVAIRYLFIGICILVMPGCNREVADLKASHVTSESTSDDSNAAQTHWWTDPLQESASVQLVRTHLGEEWELIELQRDGTVRVSDLFRQET